MAKLTTRPQRDMLRTLSRLGEATWYRSRTAGERVTLASLYYRGFATRRAWRGDPGQADAAYEYRLTTQLADAIQRRGS